MIRNIEIHTVGFCIDYSQSKHTLAMTSTALHPIGQSPHLIHNNPPSSSPSSFPPQDAVSDSVHNAVSTC